MKYEFDYDGYFDYDGSKIYFKISDDTKSKVIVKNYVEYYGRYLTFYDEQGNNKGSCHIYGNEDEMSTITSNYAKTEYIKMLTREY